MLEIIHFRGADKILKDKNLEKDVQVTLEYIGDALYGSIYRRELLRQALDEMDWRPNGNDDHRCSCQIKAPKT